MTTTLRCRDISCVTKRQRKQMTTPLRRCNIFNSTKRQRKQMTKPRRCSNVFILLDGNFLEATLWQRHSRYQVATLAKLPSHYIAATLFVYFMATSCRQRRGVVATTLPGGNVAMTKWRHIGNVAVWSCVSWVPIKLMQPLQRD